MENENEEMKKTTCSTLMDKAELVQDHPVEADDDFTENSGMSLWLPIARVDLEKGNVRIKIFEIEENFTWQWWLAWMHLGKI